MTNEEIISILENAPVKLQAFKSEVGKIIIGQEEAVDLITMSILCQGHSLLVGVPVDGPDAEWYTRGHHTDGTPYGPQSPWMKHLERGGQLLYLGTTLINSGTSLHAVEDAIGWKSFAFPIYL